MWVEEIKFGDDFILQHTDKLMVEVSTKKKGKIGRVNFSLEGLNSNIYENIYIHDIFFIIGLSVVSFNHSSK